MPSVAGHKERIQRIIDETSGVKAQYGITSWEWDRLHEWRGAISLSPKQLEILNKIEQKVFDEEDFV